MRYVYAHEPQEFVYLHGNKIAVGDGEHQMRLEDFDIIYAAARQLKPDLVLVPVPGAQRELPPRRRCQPDARLGAATVSSGHAS